MKKPNFLVGDSINEDAAVMLDGSYKWLHRLGELRFFLSHMERMFSLSFIQPTSLHRSMEQDLTEEEVAPPLIQSRRSRGPATSEGIKVAEGPQSEALLTSLMISGKGAEAQPGSPSIMMPALKVIEFSSCFSLICERENLQKSIEELNYK